MVKTNNLDKWINCPDCGKVIRNGYRDIHNKKVHKPGRYVSRALENHRAKQAKEAEQKLARDKRPSRKTQKKRIEFTGKRGTIVRGIYACELCPAKIKTGWRYNSTQGPVILCGPCRSKYIVARKGIGFPKPRIVVTNFETNKKRH
jgi:hypothetical protein